MSENRPTRILFWNIKRSAVNVERILKYGRAEEIDIILLCETPFDFSTKDLFGYRKLEHYDINNKRGIVTIKEALKYSCVLKQKSRKRITKKKRDIAYLDRSQKKSV